MDAGTIYEAYSSPGWEDGFGDDALVIRGDWVMEGSRQQRVSRKVGRHPASDQVSLHQTLVPLSRGFSGVSWAWNPRAVGSRRLLLFKKVETFQGKNSEQGWKGHEERVERPSHLRPQQLRTPGTLTFPSGPLPCSLHDEIILVLPNDIYKQH